MRISQVLFFSCKNSDDDTLRTQGESYQTRVQEQSLTIAQREDFSLRAMGRSGLFGGCATPESSVTRLAHTMPFLSLDTLQLMIVTQAETFMLIAP